MGGDYSRPFLKFTLQVPSARCSPDRPSLQNVLIFLSEKPCAWSSAVVHLSPVKSANRFAVRREAFSVLWAALYVPISA